MADEGIVEELPEENESPIAENDTNDAARKEIQSTSTKDIFVNEFRNEWEGSDIVFVVEDEEFHCHYLILKLNSPVFKVMFTSPGFKEGKEKKVNLPGKDKKSFLIFLKLIYPQTPEYEFTTDREVIKNVLSYAEEYQVECVRVHIDRLLCSIIYADLNVEVAKLEYYGGGEETMKQVPTSLEDLQMCECYELKETKRMIIQFLVMENRCMSYCDTVFNQLTGETKFSILTGKLNSYFLSTYNTTYCNQPWFNILKSISSDEEVNPSEE